MDSQQTALAICAATLAYVFYRRYRSLTIKDVPGPKNPSWIYGHQWYWQREEGGAVEKRLLDEYGTVARWNGPLGEECLWIADPKALQYILQGPYSSDLYGRLNSTRESFGIIFGRGLGWAEGDTHRRQKRAMAPAFGLVETKGLFPYFAKCSNSLADKWREVISNGESGQSATINVSSWISKATLDFIGEGAFGYDFGALEGTDNKFTKSYSGLSFGVNGTPSKGRLFMVHASRYAPKGFVTWLYNRDQRPGMVRLRENGKYAYEAAVKLVEEKKQELRDGTPQRDVLSLLVKASSASRSEWRLTDKEIVAQVRMIMFAGHDTMAKSLTFGLWQLAKKPQIQEGLRAEIMATLDKVNARGDSDFNANDFDSMPYLLAVVKEILRFHPASVEVEREAKKDSVLPLTKPIVGVSGKVYKELPVPAGTLLSVSIIGYNSNKDLWGPDAYEFRPERWLEMNEALESHVGVYANLATFSGGTRSCIGWRFAIFGMHTFLVTLVRKFEFSIPENGPQIKKLRRIGFYPVVVGEEHKGPQMPLKVTILGN